MILRVFIVLLGITGLICAVLCYTEAHDYFDKSTFVLKDGRLVDGRIVLDGKHKHVEFSGLCPRVVVGRR